MKKKLIEVALPLEAINKASAREKSIRHGHPSTLHLWWARRPLAACRAVLFASLVDDPGDDAERQRLFKLIEDLVQWENVNNQTLLEQARAEILKSTGGNPPPIYDPFCGGGSIPLEAQRLGLEAHASDLNPVAVLITKALIEIPPRFRGQSPINPEAKKKLKASWPGATGLAEDVRYYGAWMRDRARERIGHLYPLVKLKDGSEATVIAWLWARTVPCPNPACAAQMPLVRSFSLSTRKGKETWVEPIVESGGKHVRFCVASGASKPPEGTVGRKGARCIVCGTAVRLDHIRTEGKSGHMNAQLMAIVAEGQRGRIYLPPEDGHVEIAESAAPPWVPDAELPKNPRDFKTPNYGMTKFADLFTKRQLTVLTTFADLVTEARSQALSNSASTEWADAVATYLGLGVSKLSDATTALVRWKPSMDQAIATFARQAIPMVWDFAESNPFNSAAGDFSTTVSTITRTVTGLSNGRPGHVKQLDATTLTQTSRVIYSTDPPYYDNIGYADLSDFFYIWLRRCLGSVYPDLFSTVLVPKRQELVAAPYRQGGKEEAQDFFEKRFGEAVSQMRTYHDSGFPLTLFYAFKQSESDDADEHDDTMVVSSTGWETMLEGLLKAQFQIDGTWPMRSELSNRPIASGANALASSIVLVCRSRSASAPVTTRKDFLAALKRELPAAVRTLQQGNIAPVDLQQASIGPGMAVFSRYQKVLETDGTPMKVRTALALINHTLDEALSEQESDFDPDTRFALAWFEQFQFDEGRYGQAEVLATAKAISVQGLDAAGIARVRAGNVRLLKRSELSDNWDPTTDGRLTVWEATQHLIRALEQGVDKAADLAARMGGLAETARELAYRLYTVCERKGWAEEAQAYNGLVVSWPDIRKQAEEFALS
jgi:putative DNA methylase